MQQSRTCLPCRCIGSDGDNRSVSISRAELFLMLLADLTANEHWIHSITAAVCFMQQRCTVRARSGAPGLSCTVARCDKRLRSVRLRTYGCLLCFAHSTCLLSVDAARLASPTRVMQLLRVLAVPLLTFACADGGAVAARSVRYTHTNAPAATLAPLQVRVQQGVLQGYAE